MPLKDIAKGTGLSASKLQFYLISLLEVGVVSQDLRDGKYGLGPYTLQLGIFGLQQFDVYQSAVNRIQALAQETGHSVFLGVWGTQGPTIVHRADGRTKRSVFELRLGAVLPMLRSALGRLFFAYLPTEVTAEMLEAEMGSRRQVEDKTAQDPVPNDQREAARLRQDIIELSLSRCRGGLLTDHTALSAPVFDYAGKILAGITIMGRIDDIDDSPTGPIARRLLEVSQSISAEGGATAKHYLDI